MNRGQEPMQEEPNSLLYHAGPSADHPSTSVSAGAQEAQLVDAQISRYLDLIQELKSRRNTLVPVSRLPTEILCRIFLYVRASHEWRKRFYTEPSLKWIAVSQVSRHWRNAAINETRLWTNPPLDNVRWTTTMLQRSRMASLPTITLDLAKDHPESVIQITQQLHRMKGFTICVCAPTRLHWLLSSLPQTSPSLEALSINSLSKRTAFHDGHKWLFDMSEHAIDEFVELPASLFADSRRLRCLQLRGIIPDWKSRIFGDSLEELTLSQIPVGSRPSQAQFTALLKSVAGLKRLTLINACPSIANSVWQITQPTSLRFLEKLVLGSTLPELDYLLAAFDIPAITRASLTLNCEEQPTVNNLESFCSRIAGSRLSQFIGSNADARRLELFVDDNILNIQPLILTEADRRLHPDARHRATPLTLRVDTQNADVDWSDEQLRELSFRVISSFCKTFYSTGLSELQIFFMDSYSLTPGDLVYIFGSIPHLWAITIVDGHLIEALIQSASEYLQRSSASGPMMFAQLWHISFLMACFGRHTIDLHPLSLRALQNCLYAREKLGAPIRSIELWECEGLSQQDVNTLKDEVDHLVWDEDPDGKGINVDNIYSRISFLD